MLAGTLDAAYAALSLEPLGADRPEWYVPRPADTGAKPSQMDLLVVDLLEARSTDSFFVAGHVGSGKSTELLRLATNPKVTAKFSVVPISLESDAPAQLDSRQLLLRIAERLYQWGLEQKALPQRGEWEKHLRELSRVLYPNGITAKEGTLSVELNFLFAKMKQDLKLSQQMRQRFRSFGETELTMLFDLVNGLINEIENGLAGAPDAGPPRLLIIVDQMEKLRDPELQKEIFDTNLATLMAPSATKIYTLPSSISFGDQRTIRTKKTHLRPVPVVKRTTAERPEDAVDTAGIDYLRQVFGKRVANGVVDSDALDHAALYSGGVIRDFFRLLQQGIQWTRLAGGERVTLATIKSVTKEAAVGLQYGLYAPDYDALREIHATHNMKDASQRRLLDESWVLEMNGDELWFEVNPLLWRHLHGR